MYSPCLTLAIIFSSVNQSFLTGSPSFSISIQFLWDIYIYILPILQYSIGTQPEKQAWTEGASQVAEYQVTSLIFSTSMDWNNKECIFEALLPPLQHYQTFKVSSPCICIHIKHNPSRFITKTIPVTWAPPCWIWWCSMYTIGLTWVSYHTVFGRSAGRVSQSWHSAHRMRMMKTTHQQVVLSQLGPPQQCVTPAGDDKAFSEPLPNSS